MRWDDHLEKIKGEENQLEWPVEWNGMTTYNTKELEIKLNTDYNN